MHTATRLALPVIDRVRAAEPRRAAVRVRALRAAERGAPAAHGVTHVLGGEFEADWSQWRLARRSERDCRAGSADRRGRRRCAAPRASRSAFPIATGCRRSRATRRCRSPDGTAMVGYTEASRGCKHRCRHCPIVPVYDGRFRVVPPDVVLADVRAQVAAGAAAHHLRRSRFLQRHPATREAIVRALHARVPGVTYDVTIKVEHLLQHAALLPRAARHRLRLRDERGRVDRRRRARAAREGAHARRLRARSSRSAGTRGSTLAPTFVPFTPWTTLEGYLRSAARRSTRSISSSTSRRSSWRSAC